MNSTVIDSEELRRLRESYAACHAELENIANAKRFDKEHFDDDGSFADWAQSRARFVLREKVTRQP